MSRVKWSDGNLTWLGRSRTLNYVPSYFLNMLTSLATAKTPLAPPSLIWNALILENLYLAAISWANSGWMSPQPSEKLKPSLSISERPKLTSSRDKIATFLVVEKHCPLRAYLLRIFFSCSKDPILLMMTFSLMPPSTWAKNQHVWFLSWELE